MGFQEAVAIDQEPEVGEGEEVEEDPEGYTIFDVQMLLDKHSRDLAEYRKCFAGEEPPPMLKKQRILVDALELLARSMREDREAGGVS